MARWFQFQNKVDPIVPQFSAGTGTAPVVQQPTPVQYETRLQYQAQSDPTSATQFISRFVGEWFEAWTPPSKPRLAPALAIALAASGLFATPPQPQAETITADKWLYQWSEPIRVKAGLSVNLQDFSADTGGFKPIVGFAYHNWSEPVRFKIGLGSHLQDPNTPDVSLPPPILSSQWAYQWSEPVRLKNGIQVQQQQANIWSTLTPAAETVTADKWLYQWSEPVRLKPGLGASQQQVLAWSTFTPSVTAVETSALSSPVFFKGRVIYQSLTQPNFPTTETITVDKWIYPWSEPVKERKLSAALSSSVSVIVLDDETQITNQYESRWHYPWSEPVRVRYAQQQQALAWSTFTPTAVTSTIDWLQPLSVLPAPKVVTSVATFNFMAVDNALTNYWLTPWPDFTYRKPSTFTAQQQAWFGPSRQPTAEVITEDKWHFAWSEPVRTKQIMTADIAPSQIQTIQPPTILISQWFNPLSEPVRVKQLPVSEQQSFAWGNFTPAVVTAVTPNTLSSPVFFKGRMIYQAYAKPLFPPAAEVITADKWLYAWSEPVRTRNISTANASSGQIQTIQPPTILVSQWFELLSEPIRSRQFPTSEQQVLSAPSEVIPRPTAIVTSTLSSPVFFKGRIIYQSLTRPLLPPTPEVITADKWLYPWSEPVRFKRFLTNEQQVFSAPSKVIPTPFIVTLSSQVIFPRWIIYPTSTPDVPIYPNLNRLIQWFAPFTEPVRIKQGLRAWLQSVFTAGTTPLPTQVTVTLNATETNTDAALFGISVYNRPVSAFVSIKEIPNADTAYLSIEET